MNICANKLALSSAITVALLWVLCSIMVIALPQPAVSGIYSDYVWFLLQWPTIPTLVLFPILVVVYVRLANREEQMALAEFGDEYRAYMARTPRWLPGVKAHSGVHAQGNPPGWLAVAVESTSRMTIGIHFALFCVARKME